MGRPTSVVAVGYAEVRWVTAETASELAIEHELLRIEQCMEALRTGSAWVLLLGVPLGRPRRVDAESVEWCEPIPRFQRVRVRRNTCECKPRVYELCTAGGLAWVRRTDRLRSVVKVGESHPCLVGEVEELWEKLLAGRAR